MAIDLIVQESYARALMAAADKMGRLAEVCASAGELADYLETHPDRRLRVFIESPSIPLDEKHKLIRDMFIGRVDGLLVDLLCMMIDKRRSTYIRGALQRFCAMVDEKAGIYPGVVTTARDLSDDEQTRLTASLEAYTRDRLRLRFRKDPRLIGGVVFKYRDLLIDDSLLDGLDEIRARMEGLRLRLSPPSITEDMLNA